ncbi:TPA: hydrolase TatD [Candidatus Collierbacteria bacterium]|uniref:Hydrolase, TatD family n=1 Tax=Candidatus Collierbacteria bacterium GW2011_GWA2_42_17 TaxID=1618378 RepID=A0A0G1C1B0_9BACT|nr:MAG: Hydrolase, TatD family [Candidatus Collierbacteria bacterium GW2011_GWA2_42_17]KKS63059.1 MAG: Hydrolase, TatD family [Candidatus Collierbacteria bacterium GW2011_GWD2_42_50]KKS64650.1 MAG: Hydrolase, TatD family [Candidatus Collierbacteria bacterium GW2011_GWF2_42_51]HAI22912.1 hydrolase TatD [Candidatus Collierbacteria bacterium]HAN22605.1 hydrolase TatD [Candidatus Collierbacteria bacterium]
MLIDTHCHLTDSKFTDVKGVIAEAVDAGVEKIFMPSGSVENARRTVLIAEQEGLYAMVGVHPEEIESVTDVNQMIYELEEISSKSERVIGIGEIGLDFYYDKEKKTKEKQLEIFTAQIELAVRLRLPVVIHMREAEMEMKAILERMEKLPRGQFHCFAGSENFLKYVLSKGFYVSFAGNITYKSAQELRRLLALVPLSRLLLETDSPYLTPEPVRGTVNTPANVKIIATAIAQELHLDAETIIDQTGNNALCLYSLDI